MYVCSAVDVFWYFDRNPRTYEKYDEYEIIPDLVSG